MTERFVQTPSSEVHVTPIELAPADDCGVFAVWSPYGNAFNETFLGIEGLVNRGVDSNGIACITDEGQMSVQKQLGEPAQDQYHFYPASMAIGHDRYTTCKETNVGNAQPARATFVDENDVLWDLVLGHNGNAEVESLKEKVRLSPEGNSDSALMAQLIAEAPGESWKEKLRNALPSINGSYSCTILTADGMWGFCDPRKNRPLWFGIYEDGTKIISSETHELKQRSGRIDHFPVRPGQGVHIDRDGKVEFHQLIDPLERAKCSVETIYLERHDSESEEMNEEGEYRLNIEQRRELGRRLAKEDDVLAGLTPEEKQRSVVVGIPNGGLPYAEGYALESNVANKPLLEKILPSRSYIAPNGNHQEVATQKMAINTEILEECINEDVQHIFLGDDSLIRASQIGAVLGLIISEYENRELKPPKIHLRLGCPPVLNDCDFGIVIRKEELFYHRLPQILMNHGIEPSDDPHDRLQQVLALYGMTSLRHISKRGMLEGFTGQEIPEGMGNLAQSYCALGYCIRCMYKGENLQEAFEWFNPQVIPTQSFQEVYS